MTNPLSRLSAIFRRPAFQRALQIEIVIATIIAFFFLDLAGQDLFLFYVPMAKGCTTCALNPYYATWVFFPMRFLPFPILRALWAGFTVGAVIWCCNQLWATSQQRATTSGGATTSGRPYWWVALIAFPMLGQLWLGQVDALIVLGLVIALTAKNPYVRGIGLVLASLKPQISAAAMLIILWYEMIPERGYRRNWPILVIPAAVVALSLIVFGIDWPVRWLAGSRTAESLPEWGMAALWPYGAISFAAVPFMREVREKVAAALLASAITLPWFGVYSYIVFLVFVAPIWAIPLSYAWLLALPIMGSEALRFAIVLPLGVLGWMVWRRVVEMRQTQRGIAD